MNSESNAPEEILKAQQARLVSAPIDARPGARWELGATGVGPASLQATRRDLSLLSSLPVGHHLRVDSLRERPDGGLEVHVPWVPEHLGLDQIIAEAGPQPLPRVLALARGLSASLASLHQQGLVHGGLHPRLVRVPPLCEGGERAPDPYLVGAGWAPLRVAWNQKGESDPDILRYLAPEMLRGQASKLDRQADIFGLGCLVFEALTGRPVFPGTDPELVRQAILRPERPDLRKDLGPAEEPLAKVLRRCLSAEPSDRFTSATALWRELAPALGGQATPLPALHDPGGRSAQAKLADTPESTSPNPIAAADGTEAAHPPRVRPMKSQKGPNPGFLTALLFISAAAIALVVLAFGRLGSPERQPEDPLAKELFSPAGPSSGPRLGADATVLEARRVSDPRHSVPPTVRVDPRTTRLREALGRVGFTEEEVIVSELLRRHVERAVKALGAKDARQFDEAMRTVELATRPRECPPLLRLKRNYIIGGIRNLGARLGHWDRFRIERMLADAGAIPGACPTRSALLRPLVLEIRDRQRQAGYERR
ncbi:MAG: hypothetical protein RBU30_09705 [Polyangia bacterium]|nr:hypothetical protein [Polyangia bacterium]